MPSSLDERLLSRKSGSNLGLFGDCTLNCVKIPASRCLWPATPESLPRDSPTPVGVKN
jgi:hypothetical protein